VKRNRWGQVSFWGALRSRARTGNMLPARVRVRPTTAAMYRARKKNKIDFLSVIGQASLNCVKAFHSACVAGNGGCGHRAHFVTATLESQTPEV
jgi:hypothetical protein